MVMKRRADGTFPVIPPELDFRKLSRNADRIQTTVIIHTDYTPSVWIRLGEIMLRAHSSDHRKGSWQFGAYLQNATDFEHDAAWLFKIELIAVEFTAIEYGQTRFGGYIKPDAADDFRVGNEDYNPFTHPKAKACKGTQKEHCRRGEPHLIVPEGFYVPPENPELFNIVRGRRIEVTTGPINKEDDA